MNFKYKVSDMEILDYNKAFHRHIYGTAGNAAAYVLKKKLETLELDLNEALAEVTPEADALFEELFGDYLVKQLHQWYLFYGIFVPIEDDLLGCIVSYLLRSGRCRQAEKLLNIRAEQKTPMSQPLCKAMDSYRALVQSTILFWSKQRAEAASLLRSAGDIDMTPAGTAICLFDEISGCDAAGLAGLKERVETCVQRWPEEDLFKLIYVLVLHKLSCEKSAAAVMLELLEHSRNGMVLVTLRTDPIFEHLRQCIGMKT